MKTIIARFQELKTAVNDSVEIDGELVEVNKVDTALQSVGVQLRDSLTGQFRDLDDVFLELSSKWDTLDRNTQRYVATIAAGSRQQSRFIAMMDNYERTLELVDIAQNSNGASAEQFSKTLDSLESRINQIKSSFEQLSGTLVDNDFVRSLLNGVNNILKLFNNLAQAGPVVFVPLTVLFVNFIKSLVLNITNGLKVALTKVNDFKSNILRTPISVKVTSDTTSLDQNLERKISELESDNIDLHIKVNGMEQLKEVENTINRINGKNINVTTTDTTTGKTVQMSNIKNNSSGKILSKLNTNTVSLISSVSSLISSVLLLNSTMSSEKAVEGAAYGGIAGSAVGSLAGGIIGNLLAPGVGGVIGASIGNAILTPITTALGSYLGPAIDDMVNGIASEANQKILAERKQQYSTELNEISQETSSLFDLADEYEELSSKVSLTNEEKNRLSELNATLIEQYPELIAGYNEETGTFETNNKTLKEYISLKKQELALSTTKSAAVTFAEGYSQTISNYAEGLKKAQEGLNDQEAINTFAQNSTVYVSRLEDFSEEAREVYSDYISEIEKIRNELDKYSDFIVKTEDELSGTGYSLRLPELENYSDLEEYQKMANEAQGLLMKANELTSLGGLYNPETEQERLTNAYEEGKKGISDRISEIIDSYEEYNKLIDEQEQKREKLTEDFLGTSLDSIIDAGLSQVDIKGFAAKNEAIIEDIAQNSITMEDILNNLFTYNEEEGKYSQKSDTEFEKGMQELYKILEDSVSETIESLEDFTVPQQEAFGIAMNMFGLVEDQTIIDYLESVGIKDAEAIVNGFSEGFKDNLKAQYANLQTYFSEAAQVGEQSFLEELADLNPEFLVRFASVATKLTEENPEFLKTFSSAYQDMITKYSESENFDEIMDAFLTVDPTNFQSIASFQNTLKDLTNDEELVNQYLMAFGRISNQVGSDAASIFEQVSNNIEKASQWTEIMNNNLSGQMSLDNVKTLLETDTSLTAADFVATSEGFQLKDYNKLNNIMRENLELTKEQYGRQIQNLTLEKMYNEEVAERLKLKAEELELEGKVTEAAELRTQATNYLNKALDNEQSITYLKLDYARQLAQLEQDEIDRQREKIKLYKDLIAELDRYYNINKDILMLENRQSILELDFELSDSISDKTDMIAEQFKNSADLEGYYLGLSEAYKDDVQRLGSMMAEEFSQYVYIDEQGVLRQRTDAIADLIKRISNADNDSQKESLQNTYELLQENIDLYDGYYDKQIENLELAKQEQKERQKLYQTQLQNIDSLLKKIAELERDNDRKRIEEVENMYSEIKKQDNDYLDSLKKNIDKRRKIRDRENEDKEIEELQARIGLLSRDTSGIYAKEIEDLQEELNDKLQERSDAEIDDMYERLTEENNYRAESMDREIEYLNNMQALREETMQDYYKFAQEMLDKVKDTNSQGYKDMIEFFHESDEEWRTSSEAARELYDINIKTSIENAKAAQEGLTESIKTGVEISVPKIQELRTAIDEYYTKAVQEANKEVIKVQVDTTALDEFQTKLDNIYKQYRFNQAKTNYDEVYQTYLDNPTTKNFENWMYAQDALEEAASDYSPNGQLMVQMGKTNEPNSYSRKGYPVGKQADGIEYLQIGSGKDSLYLRTSDLVIGSQIGNRVYSYATKGAVPYYKKFAAGGMVDYTGPAWVDGTPSKPEAFLSASDTANIANLRDILSKVFDSKNNSSSSISSVENTGDTYYEFHITVDELGDGYDAKDMMADMEKYIIQKSNYRNVINIGKRK